MGAGLVQAIRKLHPAARFVGVGGQCLRDAGVELLYPVEQLGVMGLAEVFTHLFRLLALRRALLRRLLEQPPDIFIGVDAPDFNFYLERRLRARGCHTVHFVGPTVWAWRPWRLRTVRAAAELVLNVFPFERGIYQRAGVRAEYVGHPLADALPVRPDRAWARRTLGLEGPGPVLGLLPGSRRSELQRLAPIFLQTAARLSRELPGLRFASALPSESLKQYMEALHRQYAPELALAVYLRQSHRLMEASDVLLLASGTASLEAMLLERPMVVAYRLNPLSAPLVRLLYRLPWVSMPNILAGEALVPEFLQGNCVPARLSSAARQLLTGPDKAAGMVARFRDLARNLRRGANARAARAVLDLHDRG